MRIKKLIIDEIDVLNNGLLPFNSSKLNNTIALVGKNGSGKTRYINTIVKKLENIEFIDVLDDYFDFVPSSLETIINKNIKYKDFFKTLINFNKAVIEKNNNPNSIEVNEKFKIAQNEYNKKVINSPVNANSYVGYNNNLRIEVKKRIKVIKSNDFRILKESFDSNNKSKVSFQNIIDSTNENIEIDELSMISESALSFLQRLPHKLAYDDIDTRGDEKKFKNRVAYKRYKLLSELIDEFLGKKLEWESRASNVDEFDDHINIKTTGYWTINGRELNYKDFSDGEKVLFTYALLLFLLNTNPRIKFKESIIIIDEPELNLHPKAQIKLIESLQGLIKDEGQLIIATHSLSIISNLDYGSIFLVRNNKLFSPSSTIPFDSIDDLMGFNEHYNKIVEFLVSTPSWAMTNFMAQCFDEPEVIQITENEDPQLNIFKDLIKSNNINILDFGSGKGRLLEKIKESDETWSRIKKYDCFDINVEYNEMVLAKGASHIINDINEIENEKYDIIVIVNVLHEIHIEHWTKSLNKLKSALNKDGFIAIIEDTELPIGELPNEHGFLILGHDEFKILLGDKTSFIHSNIERYKHRIVCSIIKKEEMNSINKIKLIKTLEKLKSNSLESIVNYRKNKGNNLKLGRLYALKSNLYLNCDIAIDYLNKS
jgi:energy-coupling factor transporter ATP-binding protein EcfA2